MIMSTISFFQALPLIPILCFSWMLAFAPILFSSFIPSIHKPLSLFASRGKTLLHKTASKGKFTLPQSYFTHFYILAVFLTTFLLVTMWFYADQELPQPGMRNLVRRCIFVLVLMELQVVRRLYESAVVFRYSDKARMHVMGYLAGLFFYTAAPLSLASPCAQEAFSYTEGKMLYFLVKKKERLLHIELSLRDFLKPLMDFGCCQYIGSAIFIWGWLHQLRCHAILGSLREHKGADEYVVPHGDWFEYVSCPHYLAEIIIYAGILLASGGLDITIWLLFSFVVANLAFAAAETHKWYHSKFESYPSSRRAIIPFIC